LDPDAVAVAVAGEAAEPTTGIGSDHPTLDDA
jgi:hypothetical protein